MIISIFQQLVRPIFGTFEREEFKKFLRLGLVFATMLGTYWGMRALKKSIFIGLVGATMEPFGKFVSLVLLVPIVIAYNKLLDHYPREKAYYVLAIVYSILLIAFSVTLFFVQASPVVLAARTGFALWATKGLGFLWYVFVESFGSVAIAAFWAIASDTTTPDSAKKGFSFVVALGQMGGIVLPQVLSRISSILHIETDALSLMILSVLALSLIASMRLFFVRTPQYLLDEFRGSCELKSHTTQDADEPGFFIGLKLLVTRWYLLGIFVLLSCFEIIVTIFDYNFGLLAGKALSGAAMSQYMYSYASLVNTAALVCLLLGVNNITRFLGVSFTLLLMPCIVGAAIFGFLTLDSLNFLFWLMVGSKAINYALAGPAMKQLYIPTSRDARFKAQAWIESFGSRTAKTLGEGFNLTLLPLQATFGAIVGRAKYLMLCGYFGFMIVGVWGVVAFLVGKRYNRAVKDKTLVC